MADHHERNPRFFKVVLQANVEENMLCLPPKFVLENGSQLSDVAKLTVPDGRVWKMKMGRDDEHVLLQDGFKEFAKYYLLRHGYFLHFKYNGMSSFTVGIFDTTCCEITYSVRNAIDVCDSTPRPTTSKIKTECKEKIRKKQRVETRGYMNSDGFLSPRHFKSKKPHFEVKLKDHNFAHGIMYVPTDFYVQHITGPEARREFVEVQVSNGKWNVALKRKKCGRVVFGGGWKIFLEDNKLKEGDVCVFELIKKNVFKVHLFIAF
ncbi:AP2/B3-like transcriptional factor family protein [Euphorbia peplus]|nr:AP2/B3-like transcriptional factor family protein [Euphorbia peplus]